MGFVRHKPNCHYRELEEEQEKLDHKEEKTAEEITRIVQIQIELGELEQNLVNDECPECGINQKTGQRSRDRRASFA